MRVREMERLATATLAKLDELEGCLLQLDHTAAAWCFEAQRDVKELRMIARLESAHSVTAEQAAHIVKISNKCNSLLRKAQQ